MTLETLDKVLSESTTASDIGQYPELIKPILYKVYTESLVSEIADMQPMKGPVSKIYTLFSSYGDTDGSSTNSANSSIIVLDNNSFVIGDEFKTSTCTGEVIYSEDNKVLVKYESGHFEAAQHTIHPSNAKILDIITNRNYVRRIFKNFSGPYTTAEGEKLTKVREINHQIVDKTLEVKSRKIKSKISKEVYEDMKNMFSQDLINEVLTNEFSSEIIQSIDTEIISYLKDIATPSSDIVLKNSLGMSSGDLGGVATDLYANMYKLTIDIMRNTKRHKNFFVMADAATMGLIISSPLHVKPLDDNKNTYFMGKIGRTYDLYLDPYSSDNYVLVWYKSDSKALGDAGLILGMYTNTTTESEDPESTKMSFFNTVRYDYITHPQDTTTGLADSIFFKIFKVDLSDLPNYVNIDNNLR
jgi:hypothetical protein